MAFVKKTLLPLCMMVSVIEFCIFEKRINSDYNDSAADPDPKASISYQPTELSGGKNSFA